MVSIILLEDQAFIRKAIKLLLDKEDDFTVTGEASNSLQVLEQLKANVKADVIIAESNMSGIIPVDFIKQILEISPNSKIIFLSNLENVKRIMEIMIAGAKGYLNKTIDVIELMFAIRHVYNNGRYICSNSSMLLLNKLLSLPVIKPMEIDHDMEFPVREIEILALMAGGFTNYEIAEKLFTSKRTVEGHRQNLLSKTGSRNTAALIKFAIQYGMIKC